MNAMPATRPRLLAWLLIVTMTISYFVFQSSTVDARPAPPEVTFTNSTTLDFPEGCTYISQWSIANAKGRWAFHEYRYDRIDDPGVAWVTSPHTIRTDLRKGETFGVAVGPWLVGANVQVRLTKRNGTPITGWVASGIISCD